MVRPASDPTCVGNQQDRHFAGWWDDVISFFTQYTFFFFFKLRNYNVCGSVPGISRGKDSYFPKLGSKLLDTPGSRGIFLHLLLQCCHSIAFLAWRKQKLFIVAIAGKIP